MSIDISDLLKLTPEAQLAVAEALAAAQGHKLVALTAAERKGVTSKMVDEAIELWNKMATATDNGNPKHKLAKVVKLNPANRKKLADRLAEFGPDGWRLCVEAIYRSGHCRGINDRGWKADISYLLQPQGSNKTINGGWPADYQEKSNGGQRTSPAGRGDQRLDRIRGFDAAVRGRLAERAGRQGGGAQGGGEPSAADGGQGQALLGFTPGRPDQPE